MIGKSVSVGELTKINAILAPAIFSAYNIIILYFVLNIFITIIMNSFDKVRREFKRKRQNELSFFEHVKKKLKSVFANKFSTADLPNHVEYKDHSGIFLNRIEKLIGFIYKV